MNKFYKKNNLDLKVYRFESILRLVFTKHNLNNRLQRDFFESKKFYRVENFRKFILKNKIYYPKSGIIFLSLNLDKKDLEYIIEKFKHGSLKYFKS